VEVNVFMVVEVTAAVGVEISVVVVEVDESMDVVVGKVIVVKADVALDVVADVEVDISVAAVDVEGMAFSCLSLHI